MKKMYKYDKKLIREIPEHRVALLLRDGWTLVKEEEQNENIETEEGES